MKTIQRTNQITGAVLTLRLNDEGTPLCPDCGVPMQPRQGVSPAAWNNQRCKCSLVLVVVEGEPATVTAPATDPLRDRLLAACRAAFTGLHPDGKTMSAMDLSVMLHDVIQDAESATEPQPEGNGGGAVAFDKLVVGNRFALTEENAKRGQYVYAKRSSFQYSLDTVASLREAWNAWPEHRNGQLVYPVEVK